MPYTDAAFNLASFPLKVFDYLASGVPVVSSPLPALRELVPCVRLAEGVDAFVAGHRGRAGRGPGARSGAGSSPAANSWDARAASLEQLVEQRLGAAVAS